MSLSDPEILELNELCNALLDGPLAPAQQARLSAQLLASEEARRFYVRCMDQSASLFEYAREMQAEAPDAVRAPRSTRVIVRWWAAGALAAAALVLAMLRLADVRGRETDEANAGTAAEEFVAQVTGLQGTRWAAPGAALQPGDHLRSGQHLELTAGTAEIMFDCGAQVRLEGPAALDLNSPWDATLRHGTLKARVPSEALGFRISNPSVDVVDLGTEFSMVADRHGMAEVYVVDGTVETTPRDAQGRAQAKSVLRQDQARRFDRSGAADIPDAPQKIRRMAKWTKMERFLKPVGFVHWSFDEAGGRFAHGEVRGLPRAAADIELEGGTAEAADGARTDGRWQHALSFDGTLGARAPLPGLTTEAVRSVAFWVRLPQDAPLSEGTSMVAWTTPGTARSAALPFQIGWNSDPARGALGALRTEDGRGCTVGSTPLRDGRWHHIAVVLIPAERAGGRIHMKQYVDGRLEGATWKHAKKERHERARGATKSTGAALDTVWLGRHPGGARTEGGALHGAMDELFIADRALTPREIQHLIRDDSLLPEATAAL